MPIGKLCPSTMEGIKSYAVDIKKKHGLKHALALNLAAQDAGYVNFRHAQKNIASKSNSSGKFYLIITNYWIDKDNKIGRENLSINLSKPILDIINKSDMKILSCFYSMRMVENDHFVDDNLYRSQGDARKSICRAVRVIRFMEYTGLRPSRYGWNSYSSKDSIKGMPGIDHASHWVDLPSGSFILVDEPYGNKSMEDRRGAWAVEIGWNIRKSTWPGMYFPYNCDIYLSSSVESGFDINSLVKKVNSIPDPITDEEWPGESVPSLDVFVSPAAKTSKDRRRARSRATIMPERSATTIPYRFELGSSRRRPAGTMPIADHIVAGAIIKAVCYSSCRPYSVYQRMNSLRATLEDWLALEIGEGELEGPEFFDVYYGDVESNSLFASEAKYKYGIINILNNLRKILIESYPNCAPLRLQIHRIDISISFMYNCIEETEVDI